jgi:hypothetical protein
VLAAADQYEAINRDPSLSAAERADRISALSVEGATFDQLALSMAHVAAHADPAAALQPLCPAGEHIEVPPSWHLPSRNLFIKCS